MSGWKEGGLILYNNIVRRQREKVEPSRSYSCLGVSEVLEGVGVVYSPRDHLLVVARRDHSLTPLPHHNSRASVLNRTGEGDEKKELAFSDSLSL